MSHSLITLALSWVVCASNCRQSIRFESDGAEATTCRVGQGGVRAGFESGIFYVRFKLKPIKGTKESRQYFLPKLAFNLRKSFGSKFESGPEFGRISSTHLVGRHQARRHEPLCQRQGHLPGPDEPQALLQLPSRHRGGRRGRRCGGWSRGWRH